MSIDVDHLIRATGGDAALQHELLVLFHAQLQTIQDVLRDPAHALASEPMATLLHRLRGAAQAVGAGPLATSLERTEAALVEGTDGRSSNAFLELCACLETTAMDVDRLIAAGGSGRSRQAP